MSTDTLTAEDRVKAASERLYEAMTHHFGPLDLGAQEPIVKAVAEYGKRSRDGDDEGIRVASEKVYEAMTHHFGPRDLGAQDPVVKALAEFGQASRAAGPKK